MFVPEAQPEVFQDPARRRKDLKTIIDIVMHTPVSEGTMLDLDGTVPMSQMKGKTIDVQSAIVLRIANQAVKGDIKSADWLGKYGGLEPPKEQKVTMQLPTFYSDMNALPDDVKEALAAEMVTPLLAEDNANTDEAEEVVEYQSVDSNDERK